MTTTTSPERQALPWRLWGRLLRPYALAVACATAVLCWSVLRGVAHGALLTGPGRIVAAWGVIAVILLWVGWWIRSDLLLRWGLFWTTGVWSATTAILMIELGPAAVSGLLAGCWSMASGGAWLLEVTEARLRGDR